MTTAEGRKAILDILNADGPTGIRELGARLGRRTRDVGVDCEVMARRGEVTIARSGVGYSAPGSQRVVAAVRA